MSWSFLLPVINLSLHEIAFNFNSISSKTKDIYNKRHSCLEVFSKFKKSTRVTFQWVGGGSSKIF